MVWPTKSGKGLTIPWEPLPSGNRGIVRLPYDKDGGEVSPALTEHALCASTPSTCSICTGVHGPPCMPSALTLRRQHLDSHLTLPPLFQAEPFRRGLRQVDQILLRFGATVVNRHLNLLLGLEIRDPHLGP